jgi:hypothetical protein
MKATVYYCHLSDDELYGISDWLSRNPTGCSEWIRKNLQVRWTPFFSLDAHHLKKLTQMYELGPVGPTADFLPGQFTANHLVCEDVFGLLHGQLGNEFEERGRKPPRRSSFRLKDGDVIGISEPDGALEHFILFRFWQSLKRLDLTIQAGIGGHEQQ